MSALAPRIAPVLRRQAIRSARRFSTRPPPVAPASAWRAPIQRFAYGLVCATAAAALADQATQRGWWPTAHAEAPAPPADPSVKVEAATSIPFPIRLHPVSMPSAPLDLVGVGVRTVSFLRVKVYAAGFYLDEDTLSRLGSVPGWSSFTATHLLAAPTDPTQQTGEKLFETLLSGPVSCAIRIVPSRNTDFSHLRDGFTRALAARQKLASKSAAITQQEEERISQSIQQFKAFFPNSSIAKGKELILVRTSDGCLSLEYEGKVLGRLTDAWVAREMMVAYFADKNVISQALKEDVARGLEAVNLPRK